MNCQTPTMDLRMNITYHAYLDGDARSVWPSIEPLAHHVFGDDTYDYAGRIAFHQRLQVLVARHNDEPIGFKVGYLSRPTRLASWVGGVHRDWRRHGIAGELMRRQHTYATSLGCSTVRTYTSNKFPAMISLNLAHGFAIIGTFTGSDGEPRLILQKRL